MQVSKILNLIIISIFLSLLSCKKQADHYSNSEKESISNVLKKFPMINKNLEKVRKVDLDSLSITLFKNKDNEVYDEVLVFEKANRFYAIPFFSNMYYDYWEYKNEAQKQLFPKTNSTFNKEIHTLIKQLDLTPNEFGLLYKELMNSTLHTEINLEHTSKLFSNYIYLSNRVKKYKIEESDYCLKRTKQIFEKIEKDSKKTIRYNQYYLDSDNGRIYEIINNSKDYRELNFTIKTYRIDCFFYNLSL